MELLIENFLLKRVVKLFYIDLLVEIYIEKGNGLK
jgi:hypothetical protein